MAEAVVLEEISTGAQNDLERATDLTRKMICEFGMSEVLGPITFGRKQEQQVFLGRDIARDRNYSEEVAYSIDKEVRRMIEEAYAKAEETLRDNIDKLHLIAAALIERETLESEELAQLLKNGVIEAKAVVEEEPGEEPSAPKAVDEAAKDEEAPSNAEPKVVYSDTGVNRRDA